jgi:alpha-glucoside transport system substrate-binding protein
VVLLAFLVLVAAACNSGEDSVDGDNASDGPSATASDGMSGEATLFTAYVESQDLEALDNVIAAFNERYPDAEISHEASPSFEEQALLRVENGDAPEMMMILQPGLLKTFYEEGDLVAMNDFVDIETVESEYVPGVLQSGMMEDNLVGLPVRLNIKSLVWYRSDIFEQNGYALPETWEDLVALTDQIRSDLGGTGTAPWCIGIENANATGWVLTDWVEDVMLRRHGGDVYDRWVGHEVMFDSPEVRQAFEDVADIWFTEGNVLGGQQSIVQTSFFAAPEPMFEDPPTCLMHRQAGFIQGSFPEDAEYGVNYDFFYLPPMEGTERPVLTAGDLLAIFKDTPVTRAFAQFVASAEGQEAWARAGGMVCANATCSPGAYPDDATSKQGELLANATEARFDASDLMPAEIGTKWFWSEGTAWAAGEQQLDQALQAIDNAWPEGACGVSGIGPNC